MLYANAKCIISILTPPPPTHALQQVGLGALITIVNVIFPLFEFLLKARRGRDYIPYLLRCFPGECRTSLIMHKISIGRRAVKGYPLSTTFEISVFKRDAALSGLTNPKEKFVFYLLSQARPENAAHPSPFGNESTGNGT